MWLKIKKNIKIINLENRLIELQEYYNNNHLGRNNREERIAKENIELLIRTINTLKK